MCKAFLNPAARRAYWLVCMAVFLLFTSTSTLTLLALLLSRQHYSAAAIGQVLAAPMVPVLLALLAAGCLMERIGAAATMLLGAGLSLAGFVAFEAGMASVVTAIACRSIIGLGFGLLFSAATVFVRDLLHGPASTYYFGIFSALVPLPNAFAPSLGEWYVRHFGSAHFFFWLAIPAALGTVLLLYLAIRQPYARAAAGARIHLSYAQILQRRQFVLPACAIVVVGLIWGFAVAYVALYLDGQHIPVGAFFLPMSLAFFGARFGLLAWVQQRERVHMVAWALAAMTAGCALLLWGRSSAMCVLAGLVFGCGYGLAFPTLGIWVSDGFAVAARARVMSLFNAFFHGGMFALPLLAGRIGDARLSALLAGLVALGGALALFFALIAKINPP